MLKVGVTGGIGSGKSTVCEIFETLGIPTYNADMKAKHLMKTNTSLRKSIVELLGSEAYDDLNVNTHWIAQKVFSDPGLLKKLNDLVHPAVYRDLEEWFEQQLAVPYAIYESALVKGHAEDRPLDCLIYVFASESARMQRVAIRDQTDQSKIQKRMRSQPDPVQAVIDADYVINNENQLLTKQVMDLHHHLLLKSAAAPSLH